MSGLRTVIDQMGREVTFSFPPKRVVSLVPSQTEFLIDIGVPLVGRTKFCIHPGKAVKEIPIIGGTKNLRIQEIKKIKPDLIIGNKEENSQECISALENDFPIWMSDIGSLEDAFEMMQQLGDVLNHTLEASTIAKECGEALNKIRNTHQGSVIYLIWKDPWMAAGSDTFIDTMLAHLGFDNSIRSTRYPELSTEDISKLSPEFIFFSSEPFPFKEKHLEMAKERWPRSQCQLVDGELFSWYGSRLRQWNEFHQPLTDDMF